MSRRQPALPRLWLMTDERQGDDLWHSVQRLPSGAGIIFRHHATAPDDRRALLIRLSAYARRRRLVIFVAGDDPRLRADGTHHNRAEPPRFGTAPAHDRRQIRKAERSGAAAILLSPVFKTRSHPGAPALGLMRFVALKRATRLPVIALGGMNHHRARRTGAVGAYGWAAIDAWSARPGR